MTAPYGVMVDGQAEGEFGPPLYLKGFEKPGSLVSTAPDGSKTVWECIQGSVKRFPSRNAVGWRELIKIHEVEERGKKFPKMEMANAYQWMTYSQYMERIVNFASGMIGISGGIENNKIVIYAETQRDWMVAANAAFSMSLEVVTIYATLGEEGAEYGINQMKAKVVVADTKLLKVLMKIAPACASLKHIICMTECDAGSKDKLAQLGITVSSFDDVIAKGQASPVPSKPPQPEDTAVIMYTSGTTGVPKGVVISHGNITAAVAGFHVVGTTYGISEETVFLGYLPLAHIMEMIAEIGMLMFGASIGYGSPHTLTDTGVKLKRPESSGDASTLSPTFMVFAPAIMDKVYKSVTKKIDDASTLKKWVFGICMSSGEKNFEAGGVGARGLFKLPFKAIQAQLGGKLKIALTGSAPLSAEIQKFMQTVLNCPVRQGYGLTENCACCCIGAWTDNAVRSVGAPVASAVVRLADWAEGMYMNSDKDKPEIGMPRGEVLIGGPTVSQGYYVDPKAPDAEIVQKNITDYITIAGVRYFRTGDVGQITKDGTLMIIDRKKDLWKGPQGEYVSLGKVESLLKLSPYVEIPMVYGLTGGDYPIALVCPNEHALRQFCQEKNINVPENDNKALCKNDMVVAEVMSSLKQVCKEGNLVAFEYPAKVVLLPSVDGAPAWTPENDLMTAAMKLKRPVIAKTFAAEINACYS